MYRLLIIIFLGSVFLTSEKFVDTTNTAKFYFTVLATLFFTILLVLNKKLKSETKKLGLLITLKGLYIVGVIQAIYGILQYVGIFASNHHRFSITGSFDNPAGFSSILALLFPIGLYWCIKSKKQEQILVSFFLGLVLLAVVLSGSRTGLLSIIISSTILLSFEFSLGEKIKALKRNKQIIIIGFLLILISALVFGLYNFKTDSVSGRFQVWKISVEMIKEKPLFGYGYKGFQSNYMNYQAKYFEKHHTSKYSQLADNIRHPFNEFIKVTINYGICGLVLYLLLLFVTFYKILKSKHSTRGICAGVIISFVVFSCFSYPLQYAPVCFLLSFLILLILIENITYERNRFAVQMPVLIFCVSSILFFSYKMYYEIQWKTVAVKSLQGKTKQMLPRYHQLYPKLNRNALFLYNYGAELNQAKQYKKSIEILNECQQYLNDYDIQMLLASNYNSINDTVKTIIKFQNAANMIPCRFMPLYEIFKIHRNSEQLESALRYAHIILNKKVKVPSLKVMSIKSEVTEYIEMYETKKTI